MFERSDKQFADALENPELLEKYLAELEKQRRMSAGVFIFASILFLLTISIAFWKGSADFSANTVLIPTITLSLSLSQFAACLSAQAGIRTLKVYKKTLEITAARRERP